MDRTRPTPTGNGARTPWSREDAEIVEELDACCDEAIAFHETRPLPTPEKKGRGGRKRRRDGHNLSIRLRKYREAVLLFMEKMVVPFANNEAEQGLRMSKVHQKVSGCFQTVAGAERYCILWTVVETARKRDWDILETLGMHPDRIIRKLDLA